VTAGICEVARPCHTDELFAQLMGELLTGWRGPHTVARPNTHCGHTLAGGKLEEFATSRSPTSSAEYGDQPEQKRKKVWGQPPRVRPIPVPARSCSAGGG